MKKLIVVLWLLAIPGYAFADLAYELQRLIGFTIVASKTIAGYQDRNGKRKDDFEGCDFDRVIVFDDNKILTCAAYGYQYAYRPTAIILSNGTQFKMIVGSDVYDMRR